MTRHWKVKDQIDINEKLETKLTYDIKNRYYLCSLPNILIYCLLVFIFTLFNYFTWQFNSTLTFLQKKKKKNTQLWQLISPYNSLRIMVFFFFWCVFCITLSRFQHNNTIIKKKKKNCLHFLVSTILCLTSTTSHLVLLFYTLLPTLFFP